jgi:hypothetical protein
MLMARGGKGSNEPSSGENNWTWTLGLDLNLGESTKIHGLHNS